jgi:hypothetical protein
MNKKKITIKPTFKLRDVDKALDNWVNDTTNTPDHNESKIFNHPLKDNVSRFTIQIPDFLHRRIKKMCAIEGISMKDKLLDILLREFPES